MTKIHDITLTIDEKLPVWPGESQLIVQWKSMISKGDSMNISHLELSPHTGTHIDAPFHFIDNGKKAGEIPLDILVGKAQVIQVPDACDMVSATDLERIGIKSGVQRLLVKTRNSNLWCNGKNQFQENFVAFTVDAAELLVRRGILLVGIDYLSVAPFSDPFPAHHILLGAGVVCLEGVDLSLIQPGDYHLFCLPLKVTDVEGSPVRAVLVEE